MNKEDESVIKAAEHLIDVRGRCSMLDRSRFEIDKAIQDLAERLIDRRKELVRCILKR